MIKNAIAELAFAKYGLPGWMKPYVLRYMKGSTMDTVKHARGFIEFGRKKGALDGGKIVLPNGTEFGRDQILHLLTLFYYGEERIGEISENWATKGADRDKMHCEIFMAEHETEAGRARAIKNLIYGLKYRPGKPQPELVAVFDYIEALSDWNERLIAKKVLLNYAYAKTFGYVFYRVFYPVSPELMRSFGAVFGEKVQEDLSWEAEVMEIIQRELISRDRLFELTESLLTLIARSINAELPNARKAGIEKEVLLLRDISVAYPLHRLQELGARVDIEEETATIKRNARQAGKKPPGKKRNG